MKGLLLKDFYLIKESLLVNMIIFVVIGVGLAILISPQVLIILGAVNLSITAINTIQNDKHSQWDKFSATLPISKAQLVSSKYSMHFLLWIIGLLFGLSLSLLASLWQPGLGDLTLIFYLAMIIGLLGGSINIPCAFLLAEEKSMIILSLSYLITTGLLVGSLIFLSNFINLRENLNLIFGIIALSSLLVYLGSWLFCWKKLAKQDL